MTTTPTLVYVATVTDGADFNRVMAQRAFATWDEAHEQGRIRVQQLRAQRRLEGETDAAFVDAITCEVTDLRMGDNWGRAKPPTYATTGRGHWASALNRASAQRRRLSAGGHEERFARHQYTRDPAQYRASVAQAVALARTTRTHAFTSFRRLP